MPGKSESIVRRLQGRNRAIAGNRQVVDDTEGGGLTGEQMIGKMMAGLEKLNKVRRANAKRNKAK